MRNTNKLGDNPSLLCCLMEDASVNLVNGLADLLKYAIDVADTLERVRSHLKQKEQKFRGNSR